MITIRDDNTFVENGKIYSIDADNEDGTYTSHLVGFEDKKLTKLFNETSTIKLETEKEFKCQYCGKVCASASGLGSHERACAENPDNKKGEIDGDTN